MPFRQLAAFGFHPNVLAKLFWKHAPEILFLPEWPFPKPTRVALPTLPVADSLWKNLSTNLPKNAKIEFVLAHAACLKKSTALPRAAAGSVDTAIALLMRQTMPSAARGLLWRARQVNTLAATNEYNIYVVKQSQVDELVAMAGNWQLNIRSVAIEGLEDEPIWSRHARNRQSRVFWLRASALVLLFISVLAVFKLEKKVGQLDLEKSEIESRVQDIRTKLVSAQDDATKLKSEAATVRSDLGIFTSQRRRLSELSDLTTTLADGVWISELNILGDRMSLSGFSTGDVAAVMKQLQSLTWVAKVHLDGPIGFDSYNQQNRFQLSLQLKPLDIAE